MAAGGPFRYAGLSRGDASSVPSFSSTFVTHLIFHSSSRSEVAADRYHSPLNFANQALQFEGTAHERQGVITAKVCSHTSIRAMVQDQTDTILRKPSCGSAGRATSNIKRSSSMQEKLNKEKSLQRDRIIMNSSSSLIYSGGPMSRSI